MQDALISDLKQEEGLKLVAYQDHLGFWTIGYGRLIDERKGGGISEAEAEYLLRNDVAKVTSELAARCEGWTDMPDNIRRATANMAFQLGITGLLGFKKMWAALRAKDWDEAAEHALDSTWARQTPNRAKRVTDLIRKGEADPGVAG